MALSQLGMVAFDELVAALDQPTESVVIQRIRRALILMAPFPGEQLIGVLEQHRSVGQAEQVVAVLRDKGLEAAHVLVANLLHHDEPVREYIQQTLEQMPGTVVVPALLDALYQPERRPAISTLLLRFLMRLCRHWSVCLVNMSAASLRLICCRVLAPLCSDLWWQV